MAEIVDGTIEATVDLSAHPNRVFRALTSEEICLWWIRPGVFDTRMWTGDVRVGGQWRASGVARGHDYALQGEFVEVDSPHKLVHSWELVGGAEHPVTTVDYVLQDLGGRTRLTLRHSGIVSPDVCSATCIGWAASLDRLREVLALESDRKL